MRPQSGTNAKEDTYDGPERRTGQLPPDEVQPVILKRKLAEVVDDIDLSRRQEGERLALTPDEARLLVAEGWAELTRRRRSD